MTGTDLRAARTRLGLTQKQLAEILQLGKGSRRTIHRWEVGERKIPGPVAVALQQLLKARSPAA